MEEEKVDVAIVGAGLSGLRLADRLVAAGRSVLVLEANDRVGGRMFNQPIASSSTNSIVEGGAQFIGGTHARMLKLCEELNLEVFQAKPEGRLRWCQEIFGPLRFGLSPDTTEPAAFEILRKEVEDDMASTIPIEAPWTAPNAEMWDSQSFGDFLKSKPKAARVPYERLCTMHLGCDPNAISLLYVLFLLASTGGYSRFTVYENGAHQWRVRGGAYRIIEKLAERIGQDNICLKSPVQEIMLTSGSVKIRGDGFLVKAGQVAVSLQPQLCQRIKFNPDVTASRKELHDKYLTRKPFAAKTHLVYSRPFWRDRGYSGTGVTSSGIVFVDNTPPGKDDDDKEERQGILLAFRDRRRTDLTHDKLKAYARTLFGREAKNPLEIIEQDWSAQANTASCISHTPPNLLFKHGHALRAPHDKIHWAGAETSPEWPSFMEGALQAADRVYDELTK